MPPQTKAMEKFTAKAKAGVGARMVPEKVLPLGRGGHRLFASEEGRNGALILEVPGKDEVAKADQLATKIAEALEGTGVKMVRPSKKAELRVRGLVDGTTPSEVATAVATVGGCRPEEVQTEEIQSSPSGLGTLWVRWPMAVARKLAIADATTVGWTRATVKPLQARPLQG
nr:uncharacterized protein LOC116428907 [Nomia melanderi]